mmetsp:Transcript_30773/g.51786  ORF Transcript_30773/g.51786 Transcript_30773/m.51786 type:complete len:205 (+) Transcript_30773:215-829(+)
MKEKVRRCRSMSLSLDPTSSETSRTRERMLPPLPSKKEAQLTRTTKRRLLQTSAIFRKETAVAMSTSIPEVSSNPAESTYTTHSAPPGVPRVKWLMDLVVDFCSCPILKPSRGMSDPYTSFSVPLSADRYRRLVSWRPAIACMSVDFPVPVFPNTITTFCSFRCSSVDEVASTSVANSSMLKGCIWIGIFSNGSSSSSDESDMS